MESGVGILSNIAAADREFGGWNATDAQHPENGACDKYERGPRDSGRVWLNGGVWGVDKAGVGSGTRRQEHEEVHQVSTMHVAPTACG